MSEKKIWIYFFLFVFNFNIFLFADLNSELKEIEKDIVELKKSDRNQIKDKTKLKKLEIKKENILFEIAKQKRDNETESNTSKINMADSSKYSPDLLGDKIDKEIQLKSVAKKNKSKKFQISNKFPKNDKELKKLEIVYNNFTKNFKSKNFKKCIDFLSENDIKILTEQLNISNVDNIPLTNFLITNLEQIWETYYDKERKNENINTMKQMLDAYLKDMNILLLEIKKQNNKNNLNKNKIQEMEKEIINQKKQIQDEIFLLSSDINPFGDIWDYLIIENRAMIAVNFEYIFDKKNTNILKMKLSNGDKLNLKIRNFEKPNILNVYYVLVFEKMSTQNWKIMFFSRESFDETDFEHFIDKYETIDNLYIDYHL
ncbi:MAG: hypothetical protein LBF97_00305 [Elusimicrobiota bacterium]|jgi:hypothetical protein|nr:hypothetical protein [Elusimicrobiota bacterium]